jgi:Spy/CpxP family protein refolding chaperone
MMRKTTIALFALAAVGLAQPTAAFARGGRGGGGGHGGGGGGHGGGMSRSLRLSKAQRPQMRAAAPQLTWNV